MFSLCFGMSNSAFLHLMPFMCFLLPTLARLLPLCLRVCPPVCLPRCPLVSHCVSPNFCLGVVLGIGTLSPSGFPIVSHNFQLFPVVLRCLHVSSNGLPDVFHFSPSCLRVPYRCDLPIVFSLVPLVSQMSPGCGFPGVVSQLPPRFFPLVV